ncbi:oxidoreductase [Rhodococcus rhodochrous]|nr:oxidoreductase [Rhodococcus rhodochrous]
MADFDVDVFVIGSGGAGLAAAVAAREAGAERVMICESESVVGGSSRLSGGLFMAAGSRAQQADGIEDDVDTFLYDYLHWNNYDVDLGPVKTLVENAGATVDWLEGHGVEFADRLIYTSTERNKRGHIPLGGGQAIVDAMHTVAKRLGIDIAIGQRVDRLLVEDRKVVGAAVGDDEIRAKAVVVATGGFGANNERVAKYTPSVWYEGWSWYIGAEGARGDALDFAEAIGAQLTGFDHCLRTLAPNFAPNKLNEAFQPGWCMLVTEDGHRFLDESMPYAVVDERINHVGNRAFMIFDNAAMHPPAELADRYRSPYRQNWPDRDEFRPKNYVPDLVEEMVQKGRMFAGDTVEDAAAHAGLNPGVVAGAVARYNRMCAEGVDHDYLKPTKFLLPISTGPYYIAEVRPCTVNWTAYGFRIDDTARVLHQNGTEIQGLYAAGECTGGVLGGAYVGSGNSIANSYTIGRVAGSEAAIYAASVEG